MQFSFQTASMDNLNVRLIARTSILTAKNHIQTFHQLKFKLYNWCIKKKLNLLFLIEIKWKFSTKSKIKTTAWMKRCTRTLIEWNVEFIIKCKNNSKSSLSIANTIVEQPFVVKWEKNSINVLVESFFVFFNWQRRRKIA